MKILIRVDRASPSLGQACNRNLCTSFHSFHLYSKRDCYNIYSTSRQIDLKKIIATQYFFVSLHYLNIEHHSHEYDVPWIVATIGWDFVL